MGEASTCRFFLCEEPSVDPLWGHSTALWDLCGAHRLLVGNALGPEAYRFRVEPVALYPGRIQIVNKEPWDPIPGAQRD
jgi:hypothetical protein